MARRLAITAASSFTGLWIAREFARLGWETLPLCSEPRGSYSGLRGLRVSLLEESVPVHYGAHAETGAMAEWIRKHRPEIWVHHHHFMEKFRSPDYDYARSMKVGLEPLPEIVRALAESGCRGIIYSGTFFEPGLGSLDPDFKGTPYGISKKTVWEALQKETRTFGLPLSKFVNSNPIGPFENDDRLIPGLIRNAIKHEALGLKTPDVIGDQLPLPPLVSTYVSLAEDLLTGKARTASPSGSVGTVADFVSTVNSELIQKRLGLEPCPVEIGAVTPSAAPRGFRNPTDESATIDWPSVWDHYAEWFKRTDAIKRFFS